MDENKLTGTVKFYKADSGYGFVKAEDGNEYFFHFSSLVDQSYQPSQDDAVQFELVEGRKGMEAANVAVLEEEQE